MQQRHGNALFPAVLLIARLHSHLGLLTQLGSVGLQLCIERGRAWQVLERPQRRERLKIRPRSQATVRDLVLSLSEKLGEFTQDTLGPLGDLFLQRLNVMHDPGVHKLAELSHLAREDHLKGFGIDRRLVPIGIELGDKIDTHQGLGEQLHDLITRLGDTHIVRDRANGRLLTGCQGTLLDQRHFELSSSVEDGDGAAWAIAGVLIRLPALQAKQRLVLEANVLRSLGRIGPLLDRLIQLGAKQRHDLCTSGPWPSCKAICR